MTTFQAISNTHAHPSAVPIRTAIGAVVGGTTAAIFTSTMPFGAGAVFGATFYLTQTFTEIALAEFCQDGPTMKVIKFVLPFLAAIVAAVGITMLLGFAITLQLGAILSLAMLVTHLALLLIITNCIAVERQDNLRYYI